MSSRSECSKDCEHLPILMLTRHQGFRLARWVGRLPQSISSGLRAELGRRRTALEFSTVAAAPGSSLGVRGWVYIQKVSRLYILQLLLVPFPSGDRILPASWIPSHYSVDHAPFPSWPLLTPALPQKHTQPFQPRGITGIPGCAHMGLLLPFLGTLSFSIGSVAPGGNKVPAAGVFPAGLCSGDTCAPTVRGVLSRGQAPGTSL